MAFYYVLFGAGSPSYYFSLDSQKFPDEHGIYLNSLKITKPLIFPPVEHASILKQMGVKSLFSVDPLDPKQYVYDQTPTPKDDSSSKSKTDNAKIVKEAFKKTGQLVFDHKSRTSPEVVIVSAIDFENYDGTHIAKVVQNRVNYALKNKNYGVYVRWIQEFFPTLDQTKPGPEWAKLMILRAAMFAFPKTKYFWYLDQNAVITNYNIDLLKTVIDPGKLGPLLQRDISIVPPDGAIKTYKYNKPEDIGLIITQDDQGISTDSFIISNGLFGKALIEFWNDPLFREYSNFKNDKVTDSLLHILQWHPVLLSKTGVVPSKMFASLHDFLNKKTEGDTLHYSEGDLAVILKDCGMKKTCEVDFDKYWNNIS